MKNIKITLIGLLLLLAGSSAFAQTKNKIEIYLLNRIVPQLDEKCTNGQFFVSYQDLNPDPLIKDEEIVAYNVATHEFTFSESGAQKMANLKPSKDRGLQFALAVDRKPVVTGYIMDKSSPSGCATYGLLNVGSTKQLLLKGMPEFGTHVRIKEQRENILFINALKATGRLQKN
ncbi:hypothetical protein ACFSPU_10605 [Haoranjiania flava]|uniref:Uncharacterized protein n=1 Tax=Haoranjiania flava TaxID=1856322 RepID=A0AAE3IMI4_9BACT|nr:hypothetical protein [Haoranjiania flava]MCU7694339.1 hypothetical protein [Haoranjiania flava]